MCSLDRHPPPAAASPPMLDAIRPGGAVDTEDEKRQETRRPSSDLGHNLIRRFFAIESATKGILSCKMSAAGENFAVLERD